MVVIGFFSQISLLFFLLLHPSLISQALVALALPCKVSFLSSFFFYFVFRILRFVCARAGAVRRVPSTCSPPFFSQALVAHVRPLFLSSSFASLILSFFFRREAAVSIPRVPSGSCPRSSSSGSYLTLRRRSCPSWPSPPRTTFNTSIEFETLDGAHRADSFREAGYSIPSYYPLLLTRFSLLRRYLGCLQGVRRGVEGVQCR